MILGVQIGFKGDSLIKFRDTSLSLEEVDGVETLTFHLGTMTNMQGTCRVRGFSFLSRSTFVPLKPTKSSLHCCLKTAMSLFRGCKFCKSSLA